MLPTPIADPTQDKINPALELKVSLLLNCLVVFLIQHPPQKK